MQIDTSTPFGARVAARLANDLVIWLTTVGKDGTPQPRPVWFLWQGDEILIYTQPDTAKLAHIARNPRASLNLNSDATGGDVVVLTGAARIAERTPPANEVSDYIAKYRAGIEGIGMTPESFAASYRVPIRFTPEKLRAY